MLLGVGELVAVVVGTFAGTSIAVPEGAIVGVSVGVEVEVGVSVETGASIGTGVSTGTLVDSTIGCLVELHPANRPATAANLKNSRLDIPRG